MQTGTQGIGEGARLAGAQIAQNQQGLSSFLRDSMTRSIAAQQKALEEKKLEINTGLKLQDMADRKSEAALNRAASAKAMDAKIGLARASESRLQRKADQEFSMAQAEAERGRKTAEAMQEMLFNQAPGPSAPVHSLGPDRRRHRWTGGEPRTWWAP